MSNEIDLLIKAKTSLGTAQTEISRFLDGIGGQGKKAGAGLDVAGKSAAGMAGALGNAASVMGGFIGATAVMGAVSRAFSFAKDTAIGMNAQLETTKLKFATLMGSAAQADKHVRGLFEFAKKTPFETGPVIEASLKLQTFGGAALNTKENLTLLGDASAATGAPINELGFWVGRMYAMVQGGKPFGEAAMRLQELAVMTPQARDEMERLQKSGASASEVFGAFQKSLGGFSGAMEKQANTWSGLTSTIMDTVSITIAEAMEPFFDILKSIAKTLADGMSTDGFSDTMESIKAAVKTAAWVFLDLGIGAVNAAEIIYTSFKATQVVFNSVGGAVAKLGEYFFKLVEGLGYVGSYIPGVGDQFAAMKGHAKDMSTFLGGAAKGFFEAGSGALDATMNVGSANNVFGKLRTTLTGAQAEMSKVKPAAEDAAGGIKKIVPPAQQASKFVDELVKKMKEMSAEAGVAARNGQLELWATQNSSALLKLAADAAIAGQSLKGNLFEAWRTAVQGGNNDAIAKMAADILKKQTEEHAKAVDKMNEKFIAGLKIQGEALATADDLTRKRTLSAYDYQVSVIEMEKAAKIQELKDLGQATDDNLSAVEAAYKEKMGAASAAHNAEIEKMKAATNSWGNVTKKLLTGIPGLLQQALTGGGGMAGFGKALSSQIGGDLIGKGATSLMNKGIQGMFNKGIIGSGMTSKLASLAGPIGSLLGSLAGPLIGKLGGFFGKLFGKESAETKKIKETAGQLTELYGGIENIRLLSKATGVDMEKAFAGKDKKGLEALTKQAEVFKLKIEELKASFGSWGDDAVAIHAKLPATLTPYLAQLEKMGLLTAEHRAELEKWSADGVVDVEAMKAAADRYGISVAALGPAFQQGVANQDWQQVIDDLQTLQQGGADMNGVLAGMSDEISKLVQNSIQFGTTIPENMRPWIEKLMSSGQLLDENGKAITDMGKIKFGDSIISSLDKIIDRFDLLLQGLGLIPKAIEQIPNSVDIDVNYRERGFPGPRGEEPSSGEPVDVPGAAAGGLFSQPTFRVVGESRPEIVGAPNVIVDALAQAMQKVGGMSQGGGGNSVAFNLTTPIGTIDTIRQMVYDELGPMILEWLEGNNRGSLTRLKGMVKQ